MIPSRLPREAIYALLVGGTETPALGYERRADLYARAARSDDEAVLRTLRSQRPQAELLASVGQDVERALDEARRLVVVDQRRGAGEKSLCDVVAGGGS